MQTREQQLAKLAKLEKQSLPDLKSKNQEEKQQAVLPKAVARDIVQEIAAVGNPSREWYKKVLQEEGLLNEGLEDFIKKKHLDYTHQVVVAFFKLGSAGIPITSDREKMLLDRYWDVLAVMDLLLRLHADNLLEKHEKTVAERLFKGESSREIESFLYSQENQQKAALPKSCR